MSVSLKDVAFRSKILRQCCHNAIFLPKSIRFGQTTFVSKCYNMGVSIYKKDKDPDYISHRPTNTSTFKQCPSFFQPSRKYFARYFSRYNLYVCVLFIGIPVTIEARSDLEVAINITYKETYNNLYGVLNT